MLISLLNTISLCSNLRCVDSAVIHTLFCSSWHYSGSNFFCVGGWEAKYESENVVELKGQVYLRMLDNISQTQRVTDPPPPLCFTLEL